MVETAHPRLREAWGGHRRTHRSGLCSGARRRRAAASKKEPPRRRRRHARVRLQRRPRQARRSRVVLQRHGPGGHGLRRLGPHGPDGAGIRRVRDVRLHRRPGQQRTARRVDFPSGGRPPRPFDWLRPRPHARGPHGPAAFLTGDLPSACVDAAGVENRALGFGTASASRVATANAAATPWASSGCVLGRGRQQSFFRGPRCRRTDVRPARPRTARTASHVVATIIFSGARRALERTARVPKMLRRRHALLGQRPGLRCVSPREEPASPRHRARVDGVEDF